MTQLEILKTQLGTIDLTDDVLSLYLDSTKEVICQIRNATDVEPKYKMLQIRMAIDLINKRGVEGQISHSENGLDRAYETGDISESLISQIIPIAKTPWSKVRVI